MVKLNNISFSIKGKHLTNGVSANFEKGMIHLILGPNGAGKSTLIKLISGEHHPNAGSIKIEEQNLQDIPLKTHAKFRAVLSQNLALSFPLSVKEVVMMGRYPHFEGKATTLDDEICVKAMQLFDIHEMQNRNYLSLSGGEKQRVQFARVFAQIWQAVPGKSRLLLLDEPLTFLDIYYQYDLMKKIRIFMEENPDLTVIGVVHDINIAAKYADTIMLMDDAKLVKHGANQEVLTKENIYKVFKVKIEDRFEVV